VTPTTTEDQIVDAILDGATPDYVKLLLADVWVELEQARRRNGTLAAAIGDLRNRANHPSRPRVFPNLVDGV
jgi:hypothetical protein